MKRKININLIHTQGKNLSSKNNKNMDYNNLQKYEYIKLVNKKKIKIKTKSKKFGNFFHFNVKFFSKLIFIPCVIFVLFSFKVKKYNYKQEEKHENINKNENKIKSKNNYFACFSGMGKKENRYIRELIEYYLKLGVEKFILGDNNDPNTEKFSDVIQDYIDDGTVDVVDLIDAKYAQSKLNNYSYENYNKKCKWMMFFDFDEFLEVHFEANKSLTLNKFLSNQIFDKCEAIIFNWVMYTDNDLVYYDNRPLNVRFTEPYFQAGANKFVKSMVRGNLNKTVFVEGKSNHVPLKGVTICDSMGRIVKNYNPFTLNPPVFDYGYIKHFTDKTAEEYCNKILRGQPEKTPHNVKDRVLMFFTLNKFTDEKLKILEKTLGRTFSYEEISHKSGFRGKK